MSGARAAALISAVLLSIGVVAWLVTRPTREARDAQQPPHAVESEAPKPAVALESAAPVNHSDSTPNPSQPTKPKRKGADVDLESLSSRLREFESGRSLDTALSLLRDCIRVEWDANGRFEDVTSKFDMFDPVDGHPVGRTLPKYDPKQVGFFAVMDPRGSRWYRFTPQDFPEWWQLNYPDPASETGKQEGFAMPRRVADDLAIAIRSRAAGLLARFKDE